MNLKKRFPQIAAAALLVMGVAVSAASYAAEVDGIVFTDASIAVPDSPAFARWELTCLKETGETLCSTGSVASAKPLAEGLHELKPLAGEGESVRFLAMLPPATFDADAFAAHLPRAAEKARGGEESVLFFSGDSVTATGDYGAMLAKMLSRASGWRFRAAKHAYAGCSADASVRNFARDSAADAPDAIFVMYGLNDAACSIPCRVFSEELRWLAREAKARFGADAVYLTPTPHFDVFINEKGVPSNPPEFARRTIGFGELVRLAGLRDGVTVVDAFDAIWSIGGGAPILETARMARTLYPPAYFMQYQAMGEKTGDTIHPNALGHLRIARRAYETLMDRAKGPKPVADKAELPVDPPCWAEMAARKSPPEWKSGEMLVLGLPEHATGSSGRREDNRATPDEARSEWTFSCVGDTIVFNMSVDASCVKDGFNLFFDPRPASELGTMGPYYWLECSMHAGGAMSLRPGENSPAGAAAKGSWREEGGRITATVEVPAKVFGCDRAASPLGFSLVWRHSGKDGRPTRLSWSERCHEWNTMGYGRMTW